MNTDNWVLPQKGLKNGLSFGGLTGSSHLMFMTTDLSQKFISKKFFAKSGFTVIKNQPKKSCKL